MGDMPNVDFVDDILWNVNEPIEARPMGKNQALLWRNGESYFNCRGAKSRTSKDRLQFVGF
jgi:hypothetical protein